MSNKADEYYVEQMKKHIRALEHNLPPSRKRDIEIETFKREIEEYEEYVKKKKL